MSKERDLIELNFEDGVYDSEYCEYIMDNCGGDRIICNGDTLIVAMEDGYLAEDFIDHMLSKVGSLLECEVANKGI